MADAPARCPPIPGTCTYPDRVTSASERSAAFFDLDKTIIARSSTLAFSRPFYAGGLINRRTVLRTSYPPFVYLLGGVDPDPMERVRECLSAMCAGWDGQNGPGVVPATLRHNA